MRGVSYRGFVDPSGGRADSMTMAIAHYDYAKQVVVLNCLREIKPPFSPEAVVQDLLQFQKLPPQFGSGRHTTRANGRANNLASSELTTPPSAKPKSQLYTDLLPLVNSLRIELLHDPKLINQLCGLERRTARGGAY